MIIHDLKSWPEYFRFLDTGYHKFTIRKNDRNYKPGHGCFFSEWIRPVYKDGKQVKAGQRTGRQSPYFLIEYVLYETPGLGSGYVLLLLDGPWGNPVRGICDGQ